MRAAHHVSDDEVIQAVAIEVGEIDRHREMRRAPQRLPRNRAEFTVTVAEPPAIRILEVVADINVRLAVAIDVANNRGETQLPRRLGQWRPGFIEESTVGPGLLSEPAMAVIQIISARFAILH